MTTETISGVCPCCSYTKNFIRYGSVGWASWFYCPNCGFGHLDSYQSGWQPGDEANIENETGEVYHDAVRLGLASVWGQLFDLEEGVTVPDREQLFDYCQSIEQEPPIDPGLFVFMGDFVEAYKRTNPEQYLFTIQGKPTPPYQPKPTTPEAKLTD